MAEPLHVFVTGICSKELNPSVLIEIGPCKVQCSAEKAREVALMILAAAESATSDAFIVRFFMEKTQSPIEAMGAVISDFREFRDEQRKKEYGQ